MLLKITCAEQALDIAVEKTTEKPAKPGEDSHREKLDQLLEDISETEEPSDEEAADDDSEPVDDEDSEPGDDEDSEPGDDEDSEPGDDEAAEPSEPVDPAIVALQQAQQEEAKYYDSLKVPDQHVYSLHETTNDVGELRTVLAAYKINAQRFTYDELLSVILEQHRKLQQLSSDEKTDSNSDLYQEEPVEEADYLSFSRDFREFLQTQRATLHTVFDKQALLQVGLPMRLWMCELLIEHCTLHKIKPLPLWNTALITNGKLS